MIIQALVTGAIPPEHKILTDASNLLMGDLIDSIIAIFSAPAPVTIKLPPTPQKGATITQAKTVYKSQSQFYKAVHNALQDGKKYKNPAFATQAITKGTYSGLWRVYSNLNSRDPIKENYFDTV